MALSGVAKVVIWLCVLPQLADSRLGMGAQILTETTFEAFIQKNDKVLVDFYDASDSSWREGQGELDTAIRSLRSYGYNVPIAKVDASKEKALAAKYVPEGRYPQLLWFLHGELTQYHRTLRSAKGISDFVMALDRDPMIAIKSEAEAHDFVPAVLARIKKDSAAYRTLKIVASKHMDMVAFTHIDGSSNEVFWINSGVEPVKYEGELTVAALEKWVRMSLLKSEAIPEDPALLEDEGSKVVVGKSFEDIVLQKDKDVIMQVYAPWCGFCKKFTPVWKSFAQTLKGVDHLVVAKMDGSRNSSPLPEQFSWDSYPKVFMVKAGEKKPIHFDGERTVDNLIEFVSKHSSKTLKLEKAGSRGESAESVLDL